MHTPPDVIRDDPAICAILRIDAATPLPARGWVRQTGRAMLHSGAYVDVWRDGTESVATIDLDGRSVQTWGGCIMQQFGGWRVG